MNEARSLLAARHRISLMPHHCLELLWAPPPGLRPYPFTAISKAKNRVSALEMRLTLAKLALEATSYPIADK